ncbi:MAG: HlyD family efflux transporter periplasmic adaptor subunit [Gemmataceae bacterium]|nr:HlyD family efflux transporter periplasmic adaptor subunit [Gemmataceae bacterium]
MAEARKLPGLGAVLLGGLLLASLGGVWWWQNRPKPDATTDPAALGELDVVCLGRVDGLNPVVSLEPGVPGKVVEVIAAEGKAVAAKEPLLRLDDEAAKLRVAEAEAAVEGADVELRAAKQEAAGFDARRKTAEASAKATTARLRAAEKLLEERTKQQSITMISPAELAAYAAEVEQIRQLEAAELARAKELADADPELKVAAAKVKQKSAALALQQAKNALRDCVLVAPTDGTVLRVAVSVGETVAPGGMQAAVVFRPAGPLVVRAELDQEFLGRVRPGMKATIRDDARADAPPRAGTVERVGNWVARKRTMVLEPGELSDVRTVECVIRLDGPTDGLLVGQRVRVRIGRV